MELAHISRDYFDFILPLFQDALMSLQNDILNQAKLNYESDKANNQNSNGLLSEYNRMKLKSLLHIRIVNLPLVKETYKVNISSLRSTDAGKYVAIVGTVIRTGVGKMLEHEREFECLKCKTHFRLFSVLGSTNINMPSQCEGIFAGKNCSSKQFLYLEGSRVCRDYQELKMQEKISNLTMGSIPRAVNIICKDDLVDKYNCLCIV